MGKANKMSGRIKLTPDLYERFEERKDEILKIHEQVLDDMYDNIFEIKEVTFNSDVINSEHCIFFHNENNMFTLWKFPAPDKDLPTYIFNGMKFMQAHGIFPRFVLIPFNVFAIYNSQPPLFPGEYTNMRLENACERYGLVYIIMVSDRLKNKVSGV